MYRSASLINKNSSELSRPVKSHHHQIVKRSLSLDTQHSSALCRKYLIALQASPSLLLTDTNLSPPRMIKDGSCTDTSPKSGTLPEPPSSIDNYELTTPFKKRASLHRKYKLQNSSADDHAKDVVAEHLKPRSSSSAVIVGSSKPPVNPEIELSPTQIRPKEFKFDFSSSTVERLSSEQPKFDSKLDATSGFESRPPTLSKTVTSLKTVPKSRPTDLKLEPIEKRAKIKPDYFFSLSIDVGSTSNSSNSGNVDRTQNEGQRRPSISSQEVITHRGSCYCGSVRFEFQSRPRVKALVNCTCDSCQKYMDACLYIRSDKFRITAG